MSSGPSHCHGSDGGKNVHNKNGTPNKPLGETPGENSSWCCFAIAEVSHDILTHSYIYVWYIFSYMNGWFFMVNVGKYTSPMDPMGSIFGSWMIHDSRLPVTSPNHDWSLHSWQLGTLPLKKVGWKTTCPFGEDPFSRAMLVSGRVYHMCFFQMVLYMK